MVYVRRMLILTVMTE